MRTMLRGALLGLVSVAVLPLTATSAAAAVPTVGSAPAAGVPLAGVVLTGTPVVLVLPEPVTPLAPTAPGTPVEPGSGSGGPRGPAAPNGPGGPSTPAPSGGSVSVNLNGVNGKPSNSIVILLALTVLSVAPAVLLLCTSFTKIFVVLSITRNALGLTSVPPNQVLAGMALFLSLFVMGPVLSQVNVDGVQPYLKGTKTQSQAFADGSEPLRLFMVARTRDEDLALLTKVAKQPLPRNPESVPLTTLIPAFTLSELRAAMIIGFAVYVPFLVIDMVVSAALMSMGMMMLPPVTVSLPFKLLLFVLANGWGLVVTALVASYH